MSKSNELGRFAAGFGYALRGIGRALRSERNLRFHVCAAGYVVFFGLRFYRFEAAEWAVLALCIAGVLALELVNSALERAVDKPDLAHWRAAGEVKDMAAGGVLIFALGAAAAGLCLFWRPEVLAEIWRHYTGRPLAAGALALSLAAAWAFIFHFGRKRGA